MEINATLIGQLITFVLLVWFTKRFVWPPITKAMLDREKKIAAGLEAAERGNRELEMAEHKALTILRDAKQEATQIVDQAHHRGSVIVDEAKDAARLESKRIVDRAQDEIAREITRTKDELRKQLATLAVAAAEKMIQRNLDASAHTALLNEFAAEI